MFKFRLSQAFAAEGPGELSAGENDIVIADTNVASDGWLQVKSLSTGGSGFVPFAFLVAANAPGPGPQPQPQPPAAVAVAVGAAVPGATAMPAPALQTQLSHPDLFDAPPPALNMTTMQAPSQASSANPFSSMGAVGDALPPGATSTGAQPLSAGDRSSRHSYATADLGGPASPNTGVSLASNVSVNASQQAQQAGPPPAAQPGPGAPGAPGALGAPQDQYSVSNAAHFQETLELWRERERRFLKGEPERLPASTKREYFYWTRTGQRVGPLTEEQMRQKFNASEVELDTRIALDVGSEQLQAETVQQYFPALSDAFQTVPKVGAGALALSGGQGGQGGQGAEALAMWLYLDDAGTVQGPFAAKQMRDWFQEGYFNEHSKVKLANSGDDIFLELGALFPEGEGAFLSAGDQYGAKAQKAQADAIAGAGAGMGMGMGMGMGIGMGMGAMAGAGAYAAGAAAPAPVPAPVDLAGNPFDAGAGAGAAWGGGAPAAVPLPSYDLGYAMPPPVAMGQPGAEHGGKAVLLRALSGQNLQPPQDVPGVPSALGGAYGAAPPPALTSSPSDDWGVQWSDEEDERPAARRQSSSQSMSEAVPVTVAKAEEGDEHAEAPPKTTPFAEIQAKHLSSVDALYVFLTRSLPKHLGTIRCKIKRSVVGLHVNYNLYELYLELENGHLGPQILIAQKHRKYGIDSYYNIGIGNVNKKESGKVISSLIFNSLGTNFVCHNHVAAHKGPARDLACVVYQRNIGKGPRKFQVAIPSIKEDSEIEQVEWAHGGSVKKSKMLQALVSLEFAKVQPLVNKKPTWSKKHRAWVLNFHGRVTRSSVKNFQLVRPNENKDVVLQFGRIGTDTFTMDMSWPISPVAAMAIAVSSLHSKLAVE